MAGKSCIEAASPAAEMPDAVYSLANWFLARYRPALERSALDNLARARFEAWFPTILDVRPAPLRLISPKRRHLSHRFVQYVRRPRFLGYILIRPLDGCRQDLNRLFELTGLGGIVAIGGVLARFEDWEVELMRLAEERGEFDRQIPHAGRYRISVGGEKPYPWIDQGRKLLNLDETSRKTLSVDALGRIASIVAQDGTGI
jgi:hypothetical protein